MMPLPKTTAILLLLLMMGCFSPFMKRKSESIESKTIPTESLCPQSNQTPDELYPAWFWNTPYSEDSLFAVGYSNTFFHTETSQKEAIEDGIESLAKSVLVRIKGERGLMRRGGGVAYSGEYIEEEVSPSVQRFVKEHCQVAATYVSKQYTLVLLRLGEVSPKSMSLLQRAVAQRKMSGWVVSRRMRKGFAKRSRNSNAPSIG